MCSPLPTRCEVVLYLFSALCTSIIRAGFMLWKRKKKKAGSCFLECIFQCYTYLGPRLRPVLQADIRLLRMCWDHLVSFSRYSCWCLWSCVFFHHNFLKARCLYLARRKAAWLLVNKKKKEKEPSLFTPSKVLLMFEYLFSIRKAHFQQATGVIVCVRVCVCCTWESKGAGRKKVLLASAVYPPGCV